MGLFEMALETAPGAFGDLMLDKGGEEPGRGPAFFVGTGGDFRPDGFDGRQPEVPQPERDTAAIDWVGGFPSAGDGGGIGDRQGATPMACGARTVPRSS